MGRKRGRKRFNASENGRSWRRGVFGLLAIPTIDEANALFPREQWGTVAFRSDAESASWVETEIIRDPYGFVAVGRCTYCGGRQEGFIDARPYLALDEAERTPSAARRLVSDSLEAALDPILTGWAPLHADCPSAPRRYHTPLDASEFLDTIVRAARSDIASGVVFPGHTMILDTSKRGLAYPIFDLPRSEPGNAHRLNELTARKAAVRSMIAARDLDVLAAVTVAEAWMSTPPPGTRDVDDLPDEIAHPWMDPKRKEALVVGVSTVDFSRVGIAPIERDGGRMDEGPGQVGEIEWEMTSGRSALLDGLLATSSTPIVDAETRARDQGVYVPVGDS